MQEIFDKVVDNVQNIVEKGEYKRFLRFRKYFRKVVKRFIIVSICHKW